MRPLVGLGYDIDFLDPPQLVDLAGEAILAGPFMSRPGRTLLRKRILVVLAFEPERFISPGQFQKLENLFECFAIDPVAFALVAARRADMDFLRHLVEPSGLIAARKADKGAPLG